MLVKIFNSNNLNFYFEQLYLSFKKIIKIKRVQNTVSFFFMPLLVLSSNGDGSIGSRSASLSHASSCLYDVWSSRNNQGSLGFVKQVAVAAFYENRFFLKELSQSGFATVVPIKKTTFSLAYTSLGNQLYKESHATLGCGMKLNENISVGLGFDYLHTRIGDIYGQANAYTGSAGFNIKVLPYLNIATHVYNPFRVSMVNYNGEKVPTIFKFGAQYIFSEKVFLVAEAEKTSAQKLNVKGGIEYNPNSVFYLRVGGASFPSQASFGIGFNHRGLKIDIGSAYHSVLGVSPQIGLCYLFGKKQSEPTSQPQVN